MGKNEQVENSRRFHTFLASSIFLRKNTHTRMATSIGIINQVKKKQADNDDSEASSSKPKGAKTAYDVNRAKIEKLMKNPERPVNIPEPRKEKDPNKIRLPSLSIMSWVQVLDLENFMFIGKSVGKKMLGKK